MVNIETNTNTEENEVIEGIKSELNALSLNIKKESFTAKQEIKSEIKQLGFFDGDENGENIRFNIIKVKKYLSGIKDKSWTDLDVKSSNLEKGVWIIAIQIAINFINKNGDNTSTVDLIDGIRGKQTWKGVKEFQTKYGLRNKDGLPGHETITKILELLENDNGNKSENNFGRNNIGKQPGNSDYGKSSNNENLLLEDKQGETDISEGISGENKGENPENLGDISLKNRQGDYSNQNNTPNIKDDECNNLLNNLKIQDNNSWKNLGVDKEGNNFENKLKAKIKYIGKLEGIVFSNSKMQNLLGGIVNRQGQVILNMKKKFEKKKYTEEQIKHQKEKNKETHKNDEEAVKSWEEYRYENFSQESFEEFILSDEGISVVMDEIKSHIDTGHKNKDGEYDKFYEKYPISEKNLDIKLKTARESKMKSDYYKAVYDEDKAEEMEKKNVISNKIISGVDKIIGDDMKSGNTDFNEEMMGELNGLLSEGIDGAPINEIFSDLDQKDSFKEILGSKIKIYRYSINNKKNTNLNTGDKQIDLQLRAYLYVYGRIFYSNNLESNKSSKYYEDILPDVMRTIMKDDDESLINKIKSKKFIELENKLEEERRTRDFQRRQEVAKRNRESNNKILLNTTDRTGESHTKNSSKSGDVNQKTGEELVNGNINLDDYKTKTDLSEIADSSTTKQATFSIAWTNFIKSNNIIKDFSPNDIRLIFDTETNNINENSRKSFLDNDIMKGRSQEEIDEIYRILSSFPTEYNKALEHIASGISKQEGIIDDKIKNSALGSVVDNVKSIFSDIVKKWKGNSKFEGFKFDGTEPVKREGNNIIISGIFNGTDTKVCYDLNSGELFMNSFFQHPTNSEIVFGNNSDANLKIGQLDSFDKILNSYYSTPDISLNNGVYDQNMQNPNLESNQTRNSYAAIMQIRHQSMENVANIRGKYLEMFTSKFDMISDTVVDNSKKQNAINSTVTKFMKTFNIIPDSGEFESLQFHKGSNLFDIVQIIEETGSPKKNEIQSLEYFNDEFMPMIMEYSCLKRGDNNLYGPQKNEENKHNYDITFNDKNKNEHISLIRENAKNFSQNLQKFKPEGTKNLDSDYQLGFADFIKKNFVKGTQPDWTLDLSKMKEFIYSLKTKDKEHGEIVDKEVNPDNELYDQLANI